MQEGMGEAFLAPQGAAPAPPLQEGMGEASLAPPRDVITLGVGRRLVDARASGHLRRARAAGADASSEVALAYARLAVLSAASLLSEPSSEVLTTM
jgi:hypothetical protein